MPNTIAGGAHVAVRTYLQVDATADGGAYRVTIRVLEPAIAIVVVGLHLGRAIQEAAEQCAAQLADHGYLVSADDVLDSLE